MKEQWIELFYRGTNLLEAFREFERLIVIYKPINYHYLDESDEEDYHLFRMEFKKLPKIKTKKFFEVKTCYHGEKENYKELWESWKKMMTLAWDVKHLSIKKRYWQDKFWHKTFHCILNQSGHDSRSEREFFERQAIGCLYVRILKDVRDLTKTDRRWTLEWFYNKEWRQQKI